jgi:hypothetical protein
MSRRSARQARVLGLWTAAWLFALLLAGVLRVGDLSVQWPVFVVPVLWALVALRPRRERAALRGDDDLPVSREGPYPPTRELPWLRDVPRGDRRQE